MANPPAGIGLPLANSAWQIDELFRVGQALATGATTPVQFKKELETWLTPLAIGGPGEHGDVALTCLQTLIRHFVAVAPDTEAGRSAARQLCDQVVGVVLQQAQKAVDPLAGFGERRTFSAVAALRRSFWDASCSRREQGRNHHLAHRVIRINDIPFAESIIPALLAEGGDEFGYSIMVEDVPWSELGAALYNGRIDVAFSNGQIIEQLKSVETLFDRKLIYRGAETIRYRRYPIIGRRVVVRGQGVIGVPERSDFEDIARSKSGLGLPAGHIRVRGRAAQISNYASADDVLEAVVEGELEFGMVGGLQGHYAVEQFGGRGPHAVRRYGYLDGATIDPPARFWVAVTRRDEAVELLSAMHTLWNEVVVRVWRRVSTKPDDGLASRLVEIVNSHTHRSFIQGIEPLRDLIVRHDGAIGPCKRQVVEPVDLSVTA